MTIHIAVLVSGRGSNLESILKAIKSGFIRDALVKVVISNKPNVRALKIAEEYGIMHKVIEHTKNFNGKEIEYDQKIIKILEDNEVNPNEGLVLLSGYDRILGLHICRTFEGRIMNIHPALLPSFKGLDGQSQALEYGVKVSGATVHFVVAELDSGPIIIQESVPVFDNDTVESLSNRILEKEHLIYPKAVKLFVEGKLRLEGRRVKVHN